MPHTTQNMPMTFKWLLIFLDRLLTRFPSAYIYMFKCAHCIWQTQVYIYTTPYTHIIYIYIIISYTIIDGHIEKRMWHCFDSLQSWIAWRVPLVKILEILPRNQGGFYP
jgi:hypothetical protein